MIDYFKYFRLRIYLQVNGFYDSNYDNKLKELVKTEEMGAIIKEVGCLFSYESRYVLSSINQYLRDEEYDRKVLIKIIKDKLYLIDCMFFNLEGYNGPDLEKLYANYNSDIYQLLVERFAIHYTYDEGDEYSAIRYCNVLLGDNKRKLKYIMEYLSPSNISKLFELKPKKLETYLEFLSIGNSSSMDSTKEFIGMIDSFERLEDYSFTEALQFVYQDQDANSIYERLKILPSLLYKDKQRKNKMHFNDAIAEKISRLPKEIQKKLYANPNKEDIVKRFEPMFTECLIKSIQNTSHLHRKTMADLFVNPDFYMRTEEEKYYMVESLRKNGEELEEDVQRYHQKVDMILSIENDRLLDYPFLRDTLGFMCQEDSYELLKAKKEAVERFNGDFQDENQYRYYLTLLQTNTSDKTDNEKVEIISSRSRYLTENSFAEFYQKIENSPNKDRFINLFAEKKQDSMFFSICDIISSEEIWNHPATYTSILDYVNYIDKEEALLGAIKSMEEVIIKEKGEEEKQQMIDHLFENLKQTFTLGDYTIEILGEKSLKECLKQGDLVYESPKCKAQIKVKKS